MPLSILTLSLGPMANNTYLVADSHTGQAAVIDPSFDAQQVLDSVQAHGWQLSAIWLTHAHFDHIAGVATIQAAQPTPLRVGLHPADLNLWRAGGGARLFGVQLEPGPDPAVHFEHGQQLALGEQHLVVRHTPGHSPGHVVFYAPQDGVVFCGDLIFENSVGRTDLPGSSQAQLLQSIHQHILTLPPDTRLLPGHGNPTTVAQEKHSNPFL
jgi:hydroxyacylglutathione hydrolase